ncbi:universal stress protein [Marinomonas piezotolerans]|uniref:Universal stress protein n=1 Tax=Marinomonas piezotolerans TaxID=2213058 RepID=A0A370U5T1_9GAMM|nr:universal stress protein [Marinomonas piezotolerans]RDL43129.1 universal stress protein [Marinomonas piezotolerans]
MENILACVDGSSQTQNILEASAWVANKLDAPLVLLHALEKTADTERDLSGTIGFSSREHLLSALTELDEKRASLALENGQLMLNAAQSYASDKVATITTLQRHGDFVDTLESIQSTTRLFVMGKQGTHHPRNDVLGSNVESAARALSQPILVISNEFKKPESFMVAYDGRETAVAALERIAQSPLLKDIPCHLVMVKRNKSDEKMTLDTAKAKLDGLGFDVEAHLIKGDSIHSALLNYQQTNNIGLIAMGAYAHSKVRQFFVGSNTTKMLTDCEVPVIILR